MERYLISSQDKASISRKDNFVELGLHDFWECAMRIIQCNYPPICEVNDISLAFKVLKFFISDCGNTINADFPDRNNFDHIVGIEIEDKTMRLIWYTVDKAYDESSGPVSNEDLEMRQEIYGKNMELRYGFSFNHLVVTPSYILIHANDREIPESIESDNERLIMYPHEKYSIYEHLWGDYRHTPILQYFDRYYCNSGLVAILSPKALCHTGASLVKMFDS